jgi:hypothetical protein
MLKNSRLQTYRHIRVHIRAIVEILFALELLTIQVYILFHLVTTLFK